MSNFILKWRSVELKKQGIVFFSEDFLKYLLDPFVLLAFVATAASVVWWLSIISLVEVSVVYPIIQCGVIVVTALLAVLYLHEKLIASDFVGLSFLVVGIILLSSSK